MRFSCIFGESQTQGGYCKFWRGEKTRPRPGSIPPPSLLSLVLPQTAQAPRCPLLCHSGTPHFFTACYHDLTSRLSAPLHRHLLEVKEQNLAPNIMLSTQ